MRPPIREISANQFGSSDQSWRRAYSGTPLPDLAAARPIAAQRDREKIIVEIKTFSGPSPLNSFHAALGQYIFYRDLIQETAPEFELYLATHNLAYERLFSRPSIQLGLERNNVKFFIVNPDTPEIVLWTPQRT